MAQAVISGNLGNHERIAQLMRSGDAYFRYGSIVGGAEKSGREERLEDLRERGTNPYSSRAYSEDRAEISRDRRMNSYFLALEAYSLALKLAKATADLRLIASINMALGEANISLSELAVKSKCPELALLANTAALEAYRDGTAIALRLSDRHLLVSFRLRANYVEGKADEIEWNYGGDDRGVIKRMTHDHTVQMREEVLRRAFRSEMETE